MYFRICRLYIYTLYTFIVQERKVDVYIIMCNSDQIIMILHLLREYLLYIAATKKNNPSVGSLRKSIVDQQTSQAMNP